MSGELGERLCYAPGAFAVYELLHARPEMAEAVYIHSRFHEDAPLVGLCARKNVPVIYNDRQFSHLKMKENTFVLAAFRPYEQRLAADAPHVVLAEPSDMGNLGTITRTLAALGLMDLAIITPAANIWHHKTVRASMGAMFRIRFAHFDSFADYAASFPAHHMYPFMLSAKTELHPGYAPHGPLYSLIFGSEAAGLHASFEHIGTPLRIPQTALADSLNLAVAVGIAAYTFRGAAMV